MILWLRFSEESDLDLVFIEGASSKLPVNLEPEKKEKFIQVRQNYLAV